MVENKQSNKEVVTNRKYAATPTTSQTGRPVGCRHICQIHHRLVLPSCSGVLAALTWMPRGWLGRGCGAGVGDLLWGGEATRCEIVLERQACPAKWRSLGREDARVAEGGRSVGDW